MNVVAGVRALIKLLRPDVLCSTAVFGMAVLRYKSPPLMRDFPVESLIGAVGGIL